jgi:hypothetical protein
MQNREDWYSINEYSNVSSKSDSTIRRYIKSGKVESKIEEGKYFIKGKFSFGNKNEIYKLQKENIILKEEISELRMLVDLYEKKLH